MSICLLLGRSDPYNTGQPLQLPVTIQAPDPLLKPRQTFNKIHGSRFFRTFAIPIVVKTNLQPPTRISTQTKKNQKDKMFLLLDKCLYKCATFEVK